MGHRRRRFDGPRPARPLVVALAWDIALNATIPVGCYVLSKRFISPSELIALLIATVFPIGKSVYELVRRRELDPVTVLVLLGIGTSIVAISFGGSPRLLLIRESFFTGAFGIACLISLTFRRPIMFYFGRYFTAGQDRQKRARFDASSAQPAARRAHRVITAVWGLVYTAEFLVRVLLVYRVSAPVVLGVSPLFSGTATILTVLWTFWHARRLRAGLATEQPGLNVT